MLFYTHPLDSNLLLLNCGITNDNEEYLGNIVYASNDAGKSFRNIVGAPDRRDLRVQCHFAASSKESTLERDGIYCIHTVDKTRGTQVYSNPGARDLAETPFQQEQQSIGTLFYTTDLGKTKKFFEELNGFSVEDIFVLPSCVAVVTSEGNYLRDNNRLWISKGASFHLAHLPENVNRIESLERFPGDDQGRLLLEAIEGEVRRSTRCSLVSDSSGLNFSFLGPSPELAKGGKKLISSRAEPTNLKGTLWGRLTTLNFCNDIEKNVNLLQKALNLLKNLFFKESHRKVLPKITSMTKGSFDNGKTWTDLTVVDPSGKHRHLFKCDIDDVEHCSFQTRYGIDIHFIQNSMAGIIMKVGNVGGYHDHSRRNNDMTFISRDGGVSWEVAFEFPVRAVFLDFGNIMVAIRDSQEYREGETEAYTKFFFSMDQGRTWDEYHFDKPILANEVELQVHDLKAYMGFSSYNKESIEYMFYKIDFSDAFDGIACVEDDFETWYLSNGNCIDGMRYSYDRRKPGAKCLMRKTFEKLELHEERCEP